MPYTVTGESAGLAIGPVSETANDVHDALSKARQMYDEGLANVLIADQEEHKIEGDKLLDCITGNNCIMGNKRITDDLRAERRAWPRTRSHSRQQIVLLNWLRVCRQHNYAITRRTENRR